MIIKGRHAVPVKGAPEFIGEILPGGTIRIDDENHPDAWMRITLDGRETWELVLRTAHRFCSDHREQVEASEWLGCFYCISFFRPDAIKKWVQDGTTALCPHCGIDAVIPDKSGFLIGDGPDGMPEGSPPPGLGWALIFLFHMQERWFKRGVSPEEARAAAKKWTVEELP